MTELERFEPSGMARASQTIGDRSTSNSVAESEGFEFCQNALRFKCMVKVICSSFPQSFPHSSSRRIENVRTVRFRFFCSSVAPSRPAPFGILLTHAAHGRKSSATFPAPRRERKLGRLRGRGETGNAAFGRAQAWNLSAGGSCGDRCSFGFGKSCYRGTGGRPFRKRVLGGRCYGDPFAGPNGMA